MPDGIRLSMYQAAAMLGNFWVESKVNPYNYHWNQGTYNDCGWGLGMWTDTPYPYNTTLWIGEEMKEWVSARYTNWWDGDGQIACIFADELKIGGKYYNRKVSTMWTYFSPAQFPQYAYLNNKYPTLSSFWADTTNTNLEELTRAWFLKWESPGTRVVYDYSWDLRLAAANRIFAYLQEHGDEEINDWYYEEGDLHRYVFIPDQKAYDNCVHFWNVVGSGEIPPPGPHPHNRKGMPVWMMIKYNTYKRG